MIVYLSNTGFFMRPMPITNLTFSYLSLLSAGPAGVCPGTHTAVLCSAGPADVCPGTHTAALWHLKQSHNSILL